MKLNRISRLLVPGLLMLGLLMISSAGAAAQTPQPPTPSASPSPSSDIRVRSEQSAASSEQDEALRRACADAIAELRAARKLIDAQGVEIERYDELLKLEREIAAKLRQISTLSDQEKAELRAALSDKDRQIASLEAAIAALKRERPSFWKKLGWIAAGAGAGIVIGTVLNR